MISKNTGKLDRQCVAYYAPLKGATERTDTAPIPNRDCKPSLIVEISPSSFITFNNKKVDRRNEKRPQKAMENQILSDHSLTVLLEFGSLVVVQCNVKAATYPISTVAMKLL